ncbi:MAG: hypothetical protein OXN83_02355 [Oligoflexia bacterium]|nr:hypothetical protein [Oligoflexia bacterium]
MIKNYERMKEQLEKIENKLDQSLSQSSVVHSHQLTNDKNIVLTKKNGKQVIISLSSVEDYTGLMAKILNGEYDISKTEKEKLLLNVRNQLNRLKKEPAELMEDESSEDVDFSEEELNENFLLEDDTIEKDNFFENDQENNGSDNKKSEEDDEIEISPLISARKYFEDKSYETAISEFQKYRNENPEGNYYPEATFYIGQSFEQLKMPVEAKVFFKELLHSYPQSLWAVRAKKLLKK